MKTHIKVFITKRFKFRVRIIEPNTIGYEVTIGSKEWKKRKGDEYSQIIWDKITGIMAHLKKELKEF